MQGHWFFKNGGEKETDDSKEIYINGKQRIKARNRVEKKYSFWFPTLVAQKLFFYISFIIVIILHMCVECKQMKLLQKSQVRFGNVAEIV